MDAIDGRSNVPLDLDDDYLYNLLPERCVEPMGEVVLREWLLGASLRCGEEKIRVVAESLDRSRFRSASLSGVGHIKHGFSCRGRVHYCAENIAREAVASRSMM